MEIKKSEQRRIFTISAPSGTGKNTVIKAITEKRKNIIHAISSTTRSPREGETHGKEYYFLSESQFIQMINDNHFLEWAKVLENYYGTSTKEIQRILNSGNIAILDIDIQGAFQMKEKFPMINDIFLIPPSLEILEKRLRARKTETEEQIKDRLFLAQKELSYKNRFTTVFVNDELEATIQQIENFIINS